MKNGLQSFALLVLVLTLALGNAVHAQQRVPATGDVVFGTLAVNALVLINGQSQFTGSSGRYDLEVPLDAQGMVRVQAFASGFAPFKATISPAEAANYRIVMENSRGEPDLVVDAALSGVSGGRGTVVGSISSGEQLLCGLALANGQSTFTCGDSQGEFLLDVPLDGQGNVVLQIFVAGFKPFRVTLFGENASADFNIQGSVVIPAGLIADSDTNDPGAPYEPNDTISDAQLLPNPGSVGGYVNDINRGEPGPSTEVGDFNDLYQVELVAGQQLTLTIGDIGTRGMPNDLDLFLLDLNGNIVQSSNGIDVTESIIARDAGIFIAAVTIFEGASTYVLTLGQALSTSSDSGLSVMHDFVPGEALVRMRPDAKGKGLAQASVSALSQEMGVSVKAGTQDREMLVGLYPQVPLAAYSQGSAIPDSGSSADVPYGGLFEHLGLEVQEKLRTLAAVKRLRHRTDVESADLNYRRQLLREPNDEFYRLQWHYPMISLPQAWDLTVGSPDVVVAVVDSGVITSHPDLASKLLPGYDFISDSSSSLDGDGIDPDPDDPGDPLDLSAFHGTHVAGTIGAATNNGRGVAGVSWGSALLPLRALTDSGGTTFDIIQAVRYAAGMSNNSNTLPAQPADVINLSIGGAGFSSSEQQLYNDVRSRGIIVIAAAGNEGSSLLSYPASYDGVVSVSAVNISRGRASYSNFGSRVDVAAPGGDFATGDVNGDGFADAVLSTRGDNSEGSVQAIYDFLQGTSMATPHVAGVAALMKAVNPDLTPAGFDQLLINGRLTVDLGTPGRDDFFGFGLIDAQRAVVAAGGASQGPFLIGSPQSLNFGLIGQNLTITLQNAGSEGLSINAPTSNVPWLGITAVSVDGNGLGTYSVVLNRNGLGAGTYQAAITATSNANTVSIPVIMQVGGTGETASAGQQYILLVDPDTFDTVDFIGTGPASGSYNYRFENIPAGSYLVFSGSDANFNGFICDIGESCGAYLTVDEPAELLLTGDTTLEDFATGYITTFFSQSAAASTADTTKSVAKGGGEKPATPGVPRVRIHP